MGNEHPGQSHYWYVCNFPLPKPDEPEPKRQSLRGAQRRGNPDNFIKGLLNGWIAALRSQ